MLKSKIKIISYTNLFRYVYVAICTIKANTPGYKSVLATLLNTTSYPVATSLQLRS